MVLIAEHHFLFDHCFLRLLNLNHQILACRPEEVRIGNAEHTAF